MKQLVFILLLSAFALVANAFTEQDFPDPIPIENACLDADLDSVAITAFASNEVHYPEGYIPLTDYAYDKDTISTDTHNLLGIINSQELELRRYWTHLEYPSWQSDKFYNNLTDSYNLTTLPGFYRPPQLC